VDEVRSCGASVVDDVRDCGTHKYLVLGATQEKSTNMFVHCSIAYIMHLWKQRTHVVVLLWNVIQSYHDLKEVYKTTELLVQFMCESSLYLYNKRLAYNFDLGLFCKKLCLDLNSSLNRQQSFTGQ
jgi:hypothetical protein